MARKDEKATRRSKPELTEEELGRVKAGASLAGNVTLEESLVSPRDSASGLPTGKRQHKPLG